MALVPGTLPPDTCYGSPQDLLDLFAQYLDIPAVSLSSKVIFSTVAPADTLAIWFDTNIAINPILSIYVSGSWLDYIKNYITQAPTATIVGGDFILFSDTSLSGNTKKGLVSDIAALAVPAAGSVTPAQLSQPFTRGTAVASTGGTAIDFTGIPSWVKRVTVMFDGLSTTGASLTTIQIQFGDSGGIETTGYVSGNQGGDIASGFLLALNPAGGYFQYGAMVFTNLSGNTWVQEGVALALSVAIQPTAGSKTLSGTLDRVRFTTVGGTDTFDGGSVNIMYE